MRRAGVVPVLLGVVAGTLFGCSKVLVPLGGPADAGRVDGSAIDAGPPPIPGLTGLRIEPPSQALTADGRPPAEQAAYRALGQFADGPERDVTELVGWSVSDPAIGEIAQGVFVSADVGGSAQVIASSGDARAEARIDISLDIVVSTGTVPANADQLFGVDVAGDAVGGAGSARLVYPADGTKLPRNVHRVLFQWDAAADQDLFELRFESNVGRSRYFTTVRELLPELDQWQHISATHAGRSVQLFVRSLSLANPQTVYRSAPITISFSEAPVEGPVYFWSTSAQGILQAEIGSGSATAFFPRADDPDPKCVSCHTLSRDGRYLAAGYDGEKMRLIDTQSFEIRHPTEDYEDGSPAKYGWGAFNPQATMLLVSHKGELELFAVPGGDQIREVEVDDFELNQLDWSPAGDYIVGAYQRSGSPGNKSLEGTGIGRFSIDQSGRAGDLDVLVASMDDDDTLFFPTYSPDGRWIAFVRTVGKSKDSRFSELYIVRSDGSGPPILLEALNRTVGPNPSVVEIGNTMPTWGPSAGGESWIAFSSIRDYGKKLVGEQRDQLWVAAIDLDAAAGGRDPSSPAFWAPFQGIDESNHRAFWVAAEAMGLACGRTIEICDGIDNNCNNQIDEACCTPSSEVCGDALDNDCDGVSDEGCDCADREICSNGVDDDCDLQIDAEDEECVF